MSRPVSVSESDNALEGAAPSVPGRRAHQRTDGAAPSSACPAGHLFYLRGALALLASLLAACSSSSFDRQWKEAGKNHATRWDGQWTSGKNVYANGVFHHGRLRCVLTEQPDRSLEAHFHANWLIFAGDFDTALQPVLTGPRRRNVRKYAGTHDLPAIYGGTYHYLATIEGDRFLTHYSSSYDVGTFDLHREKISKDCFPPRAEH